MGDQHLTEAEIWQRRAEKARAQAEMLRDHDSRRTLLDIADHYESLAARVAATKSALGWAKSEKP
jgi:hypothetical protein